MHVMNAQLTCPHRLNSRRESSRSSQPKESTEVGTESPGRQDSHVKISDKATTEGLSEQCA